MDHYLYIHSRLFPFGNIMNKAATYISSGGHTSFCRKYMQGEVEGYNLYT